MKLNTVLLTVVAAVSLSACSGMGRGAPDEFEVVSNSSLVVPPDMELAPPKAGKAESREIAPNVIAKNILFPKKVVKSPKKPMGAELDVLKKLKHAGDNTARSNVGQPELKVSRKSLLLAEILEMKDGSEAPDNISVKRVAGDN